MKYALLAIISIFFLLIGVSSVFADGLGFSDIEVEVDGDVDSDVDASGGSFEASPGDSIVISVEVENTFSSNTTGHEIQSIDVTFDVDSFCPEDLDDKIREKLSVDNLDPGVDDSVTFRFEIPDCADEDNYDIDIRVEGKDDDDNTEYVIEETLSLTVEKEPSEITLSISQLDPSTLSCDDLTFSVTVEARNIGATDQDTGILLINDDLGINRFEFIELGTGRWTDDDTLFLKTYILTVADSVPAGEYDLRAEVEYEDGDREEKRFQAITVPECVASLEEAAQEKTAKNPVESQSTIPVITDITKFPEQETEEAEETKENIMFSIPVLVASLFLGLIILFAMIAVLGKKK